MSVTTRRPSFPDLSDVRVVVGAPGDGPGNWAGAPSAICDGDDVYLAYRVRRPQSEGRGVTTVVARSADGTRFTTVCEVYRDDFGAESFERPVVSRTENGWRLYLSCATPASKHWWVEAVDADSVDDLPRGRRTVVFPGGDRVAMKDPVIRRRDDGWHAWICEHPLDVAGHEDRMSTSYWRSADGLVWHRKGTVLAPRDGEWDMRGARVTDVLSLDPLVVLYDGRARAEENWSEVTGMATGSLDGVLTATEDPPLRSPFSDGAARYATHVTMPDGSLRYYLELARPDGAHDLVTTPERSWAPTREAGKGT
jgi:hypothetical protein